MKIDKVKILFIEDSADDFALILREFKKANFDIDYTLIDKKTDKNHFE